MVKTTKEKDLNELKKEVIDCVYNVGDKSFVYLQEFNGMVKIKGSFSENDAISFINELIQKQPKIKECVAKLVNN